MRHLLPVLKGSVAVAVAYAVGTAVKGGLAPDTPKYLEVALLVSAIFAVMFLLSLVPFPGRRGTSAADCR